MGRNQFCVINSVSDLNKVVKERTIDEGDNSFYDIYVSLKEYSNETMDGLLELVCKMKYLKYSPIVHFDIKELELSEQDFELIVDFYVEMQNMNVGVDFYDVSESYPIEKGVDAFFNAEAFIDAVKALDLSPLETHYLIHSHLSSIKYKENEENKRKSRTLINVLTGEDIVCLGYAKLEEYLHSRLGIHSVVQILNSYKKGSDEFLGTHANNLVYIQDSKYKVKGFGYSDVTWDVFEKEDKPFLNYLFAFLPLNDKERLKKEKLVVYERALNALYDKEDKILLIEDMLLDMSTCRKAFNDFGLTCEFEEIEREVEKYGAFFLKKQDACKKVKQLLKDNGIKKDVYKDSIGMPEECSLAFLIAEQMQEEIDESIVNLSLSSFNNYSERRESFDESANQYGVSAVLVDNYIKTLNEIASGEDDSFDNDIKEAYIRLKSINILEGILKNAASKPLSLNTIKEVIANVYRKQGADEKFINYQINEIINKCVKQADEVFDDKAKNCFKKEALKRKKEEQKREID